MDTLLVNPNNRILSPFAGFEQPFWAGMIAQDLRLQGKDVSILDSEILDLTPKETISVINKLNPKHIIFVVMGQNPSVSSTPKMKITKSLIDTLIGDYDIKITGLHPTALPQKTKDELGIEVLRGKVFNGTPDMPYDLYDMRQYIAHQWHCLDGSPRKPYAVSYTSLGCSNNCSFCNVNAIYGYQRKVWYREIDAFLKEIDLLVNKYQVRNIKLWDEHFTVNRKRVIEICNKLIERKYDLNIWAYARVDSIDREMLDKMGRAGIKWAGVGFESGNDNVLGQSNKRASVIQAKTAVKMIHDAGINVMGNFILGLPGDTVETMQQTMDFAKSLNIEFINLYVAENYPGSDSFNTQEKSWEQYGQFTPGLEKNKIRQFRDQAFNDYFLDGNYLKHIESLFGYQAVKQVKDMVAFGKPATR